MSIRELKQIIGALACSQGFYGRLKEQLTAEKKWGELSQLTKKHKIKNSVDLVLFLEG